MLLEDWLFKASAEWTLDIGSGGKKFGCLDEAGRYCALDLDVVDLAQHADQMKVQGTAARLPFADDAMQLVVLHNSLEHILEVDAALDEIARVLGPQGQLLVTVPDGRSFSDRLYRILLCGGGHVNQFAGEEVVQRIEARTGLHLLAGRRLYSSFGFVKRENFVEPGYARPGHGLPRRIRWLGKLPLSAFLALQRALYRGTRWLDGWAGTSFSLYGWSMAFGPKGSAGDGIPDWEEGAFNVCPQCGNGLDFAGASWSVTCSACGAKSPYVARSRRSAKR